MCNRSKVANPVVVAHMIDVVNHQPVWYIAMHIDPSQTMRVIACNVHANDSVPTRVIAACN